MFRAFNRNGDACLTYFVKILGCQPISILCSMAGLGKRIEYFDFDWKAKSLNFVVVLGAMAGGFVAVHFMRRPF